jgi:two-component SAPR family response regulator
VDLFSWEEKLEKLPAMVQSNIGDYESVMELYTGDYLSDYDFTWLESERERLKTLWVNTAAAMAAFYKKEDRIIDAIRWYKEITEHFPTMEEAHFNLMKLYEANNEFTLMMQQYSILHKISRDYYDTKPDQRIIDWYVSKLR